MIDSLVVKRVRQKRSQVWFNEELQLAKLRRAMRKAESQWLRTSGRVRSEKRLVYVERRREYCRAVKKAKKAYKERLCNRLEEKHGSNSFWKEARAIGLCNKNQSSNLKEVLDEGQVKSGDEAVDVWRSHFQVLLGGDMSIPQSPPSNPSCPSDHMSGLIDTEISEILSKCISQEEVRRYNMCIFCKQRGVVWFTKEIDSKFTRFTNVRALVT